MAAKTKRTILDLDPVSKAQDDLKLYTDPFELVYNSLSQLERELVDTGRFHILAERAIQENRVFLTQDTDFLALSSQLLSEGKHHPGVIYWPQGTYTIGQIIRKLKQYLETTTPESRRDLVKFL